MRKQVREIDITRLDALVPLFGTDEGIVLAFLFGSHARGHAGPLSDVDLGILLAPSVSRDQYLDYQLKYIDEVSRLLHDDRVDLIILNTASPLLAHEAIRGRLLFERSPEARVDYIVGVQRKYLDLKPFYAIDHRYMEQRLKEGKFGQP